jgi:hypothetical protein
MLMSVERACVSVIDSRDDPVTRLLGSINPVTTAFV